MIIPLGISDFESQAENLSRLKVHNMYLAESPSSPDGIVRLSRPTLRTITTVGTGPIRGVWRQEGTFAGDWLVVSGHTLYRLALPATLTVIGTIPGSDLCQFVGGKSRVLIVSSGLVFSTDGTLLTSVVMPNALLVKSLAYINGYYLLSVLDSDVFYWMAPGDTNPDPLSFATAERSPDAIEAIAVISDEVWFIGKTGVEVWTPTGSSSLPFQRTSGRVYNDGCADRNTLVVMSQGNAPAAFWVTTNGAVIMARGTTVKISDTSVEEALKTATSLRAWGFRHNRHDFYLLTSDTFTVVFDIDKGNWLRWDSYNKTTLNADLGVQVNSTPYGVNTTGNQVYILEVGENDDGNPVIREISGGVPLTSHPEPCYAVTLRVNSGWSATYGYEPIVELRWSDDQGMTWSPYRQRSLGDKGVFAKDVTFRSLGLITRPGRIFEVRFASNGRFSLTYATLNEDS